MSAIEWHVEKRKIGDLRDFEGNPRTMTKKAFKNLVNSIKEDGFHQLLIINTDDTIVGGHARRRALLEAGRRADDEIEVLVPSRELTEDEFCRINIRDNGKFGDFDFEELANLYEADELEGWGVALSVFDEPKESVGSAGAKEKKKKECPECGHRW